MRYLIRGKLTPGQDLFRLPHDEFVQLIQTRVIPSMRLLVSENPHGKVLAGGVPAGGRDVVMIVDFRGEDSHRPARRFLTALPIFEYYDWEVTPLETFEEWIQPFES